MDQTIDFESRLQGALKRVKTVLHVDRHLCFASGRQHLYQDKYLLAETLTNAAIASHINCMVTGLGLSADILTTMAEWLKSGSSVSLLFVRTERSDYDRKELREVVSPSSNVVEASVESIIRLAFTSKVVTTVEDHFWKCHYAFDLVAVRGAGDKDAHRLSLLRRSGIVELKTGSKSPPRVTIPGMPLEINVSWFLQQLAVATVTPRFHIDRDHNLCHTPRRNPDVDQAIRYFTCFKEWAESVAQHLQELFSIRSDSAVPPSLHFDVFVPVLPLLRDVADPMRVAHEDAAPCAAQLDLEMLTGLTQVSGSGTAAGSVLLSTPDSNALLAEEVRGLRETRAALQRDVASSDAAAATATDGIAIVTLRHCRHVVQQWLDSLDYIEGMLRSQLVAAIGKEVSPADLTEYMQFHFAKNFRKVYAPQPFCYAVRRSDSHSPEGMLSIEEKAEDFGSDSCIANPISTFCAQASRVHTMQFALGASTNVKFTGQRYLHAYLQHQFSGQAGAKLSLVCRARQFSSMIVLIGRISSATVFQPQYASVVQNRDELKIPLDLSTLPTAREFKDAIESLSPEQQTFAKAFRSMQLESTLFGILVIQIKPQLEQVLNLASNTLTKEIKLTQEVMRLFITFQLSSDLLSFDPDASPKGADGTTLDEDMPPFERLVAVRKHVAAMLAVIQEAKETEMEEKRLELEYAMAKRRAEEEARRRAEEDARRRAEVDDEKLQQLQDQTVSYFERTQKFSSSSGRLYKTTKPCSFGFLGNLFQGFVAPRTIPSIGCSSLPAYTGSSGAAVLVQPAAPVPTRGCMASLAPSVAKVASPASPANNQDPLLSFSEQSQPSESPPQPHQQQAVEIAAGAGYDPVAPEIVDYTQIPKDMDARFDRFDIDSATRPTIINPGKAWNKREFKALLAKPSEVVLMEDDLKRAKNEAFELLDALTRSGGLLVEDASLHVVVAATHCFDKTVTEAVIQDNCNPIAMVELSALIMASTVHRLPAAALLRDTALHRISASTDDVLLENRNASVCCGP